MGLSEEIRPVTDLKRSAAELIQAVSKNHRPIVITQHGRARAVLLDISSYEELTRSVDFDAMIERANADFAAGRVESTAEVRRKVMKRLRRRRSPGKP